MGYAFLGDRPSQVNILPATGDCFLNPNCQMPFPSRAHEIFA